jgi:oligogalacturonide transport system ATP-binding protein
VGRAIVKEPEVFLFDEPLSNLDAKLRAAMRVRLTELHRTLREQGRPATVIYVTHDQTEAMTMGERICVLKEGVIQQVDTPVALYRRPANAFVAGFIGSPEMNIVDAQLVTAGDGLAVRLGDHTLPLPPARMPRAPRLPGAVKFGLRPEHIGVAPLQGSDGGARVPARLRFAEHMGNEVFVHAEIGSLLLTARVPAPQAEALDGRPRGTELTLHLRMDEAHLFDLASGASLA